MNTPRPIHSGFIIPVIGVFLIWFLLYSGKNIDLLSGVEPSDLNPDTVIGHAGPIYGQKQKGMHFFGRRSADGLHLTELKRNHIEWLTFVPYGWQADYDSERIGRRGVDYQSWTRRDSAYAQQISRVKENGFRVMMKPHIWMGDNESGKWRSEIDPRGGKAGWEQWAASYRDFILHYAVMSEQLGVEMFCIGTELHKPIKQHPEFWKQLIVEVRSVYSGKLTYAANWYKEVDDVSFWEDLDFIGVQAYYPLCKQTDPPLKNLLKGWKPYVKQLEKLHHTYNKPVLFTEIGYKSTPNAAIEPWEWVDKIKPEHRSLSLATQANCYEAFFRTFWHREWFAGAHFWQWRSGRRHHQQRDNLDFTPQNKPAEQTLSKWFAR
jgi:hypothetical protein